MATQPHWLTAVFLCLKVCSSCGFLLAFFFLPTVQMGKLDHETQNEPVVMDIQLCVNVFVSVFLICDEAVWKTNFCFY